MKILNSVFISEKNTRKQKINLHDSKPWTMLLPRKQVVL